MSKAFCCDNCHDLFAGAPDMVDAEGNEFCAGCVRVMKVFKDVDPLKVKSKSRCDKCVHQLYSCVRVDGDKDGDCPHYKRDPKDGGYYG